MPLVHVDSVQSNLPLVLEPRSVLSDASTLRRHVAPSYRVRKALLTASGQLRRHGKELTPRFRLYCEREDEPLTATAC